MIMIMLMFLSPLRGEEHDEEHERAWRPAVRQEGYAAFAIFS
jgi:hypothetical protein